MVSTNPAFLTAIKNAICSDQELYNLLTDMVTSNLPLKTHQKGFSDVRITLYADNHTTMFVIHVSSPQSLAPTLAQYVSVILPHLPMAYPSTQIPESDYDAQPPEKPHGGRRKLLAECPVRDRADKSKK